MYVRRQGSLPIDQLHTTNRETEADMFALGLMIPVSTSYGMRITEGYVYQFSGVPLSLANVSMQRQWKDIKHKYMQQAEEEGGDDDDE